MTGLASDLVNLLSESQVFYQPEDLLAYACDATHYFAKRTPDAAALPKTAGDVSKVLRYAYQHEIPVTPRGAGSGLSGACTPVKGGIVMDMKRMNRIVEIDRESMVAEVEPGVVLADFNRALVKRGLFYPPDPQSGDVCTLGGNIATRAGGPRCVKYGTTGNYILGVEVVLPDGTIIHGGGKMVKQSVGYDITHLMTGSEGTLGVITRANFRLIPLPPCHRLLILHCDSLDQGASAVPKIIASGTVPAQLEFFSNTTAGVMNMLLTDPYPLEYKAFLLVDVDGTEEQVESDSRAIEDVCREIGIKVRQVREPARQADYWAARAKLMPAVLNFFRQLIVEDMTVPRSRIPDFVRAAQVIGAEIGVNLSMSGHAGDGNVHPSITQTEVTEEQMRLAHEAFARLVRVCLDMKGTISGEHGIGIHKSEFLAMDVGEAGVELMKRIKKAFDPKGIMNPGKIWVEEAN
jgi:glycolate oxidase